MRIRILSGDWLFNEQQGRWRKGYVGNVTSRWSGGVSWEAPRAVAEQVARDQVEVRNEIPEAEVLTWFGDELVMTWAPGNDEDVAPATRLKRNAGDGYSHGYYEMPGWTWCEVDAEDCDEIVGLAPDWLDAAAEELDNLSLFGDDVKAARSARIEAPEWRLPAEEAPGAVLEGGVDLGGGPWNWWVAPEGAFAWRLRLWNGGNVGVVWDGVARVSAGDAQALSRWVRDALVAFSRQQNEEERLEAERQRAWESPDPADSQQPARVEVLHVRDSDASCQMQVFVHGERVTDVREVDVDPGSGWTRSEWNERVREAQAMPASAFRDAYIAALLDSADDPSIVED